MFPSVEVKKSDALEKFSDVGEYHVILIDHDTTSWGVVAVLDPESIPPNPLERNTNPLTRVYYIHC